MFTLHAQMRFRYMEVRRVPEGQEVDPSLLLAFEAKIVTPSYSFTVSEQFRNGNVSIVFGVLRH